MANASFVGAAIGFGLCPAVLAGRPDNVPKLLLLTLGLAALPLAAVRRPLPMLREAQPSVPRDHAPWQVLAYCPDRPARPPSAAVVEAKGQRSQRPGEFIRGVVRAGAPLRSSLRKEKNGHPICSRFCGAVTGGT